MARVTRQAVTYAPENVLPVHAAALAPDGENALLFPGRSGSGKSTLSAALAIQGLEYLTDDVALVDPQAGRCQAFPRPLELSEDSWAALRSLTSSIARPAPINDPRPIEHYIPASQLGGRIRQTATLAGIIFPKYEKGGPAVVAHPLTPAEALIRLFPHLLRDPDHAGRTLYRAVDALARVASALPAVTLDYSSLNAATEWIAHRAGSQLSLTPRASRLGDPASPGPGADQLDGRAYAYVFGDEAVVIDVKDQAMHLVRGEAATALGRQPNSPNIAGA